jgi:hypothetical protein
MSENLKNHFTKNISASEGLRPSKRETAGRCTKPSYVTDGAPPSAGFLRNAPQGANIPDQRANSPAGRTRACTPECVMARRRGPLGSG